MKRMLALCGLLVFHHGALNCSTAFFSIRSQSVNAARDLVGWQPYINLCDGNHGALAITPEYTQSFHPAHLARNLFGDDLTCNSCGSTIQVSGTAVPNRGPNDWLADYFGLPRDFKSTLTFTPRVQNFLIDFAFYLGHSSGLFIRAHAPIVRTKWHLKFTEEAIVPGVLPYDPGYFDASNSPGDPRTNLVTDATAFFTGSQVPQLQDVTFQPLSFGKFASCKTPCEFTKTKFSDVEFALGWNFWRDDCHIVGASIRASAPLGNKPNGKYFFEPIIGSGGNWKLGLGIDAQTQVWADPEQQRAVWLYLEAHVQHLFKTRQHRCFDLCGKPNSRYMLAQKLGTTRQPIHLIGASDAGVEFQSEFAPVANITASPVKVSAKVEGDVAVKISYYACSWSWDFGYNFWGRSGERIRRCPGSSDPLDGKTWALKGDVHVIGFAAQSTKTPVNLAAAEADATIHNGTNNYVGPNLDDGGVNGIRPTANPGISNPEVLIGANGATGNLTVNDRISTIDGIPTRSSNPVPFISESTVDLVGTKGLSHKIFTHYNYGWEKGRNTAYLGFGAEVEFNHKHSCKNEPHCIDTNCSLTDCELFCPKKKKKRSPDCVLNQWGIWIKGGVAFK